MANIIYVKKAAGQKKDAVRINSTADIPEFLKETVTISNNMLKLVCVEGIEVAPLGSVIGYETSDQTNTGYNTWVIGNASNNLIEIDGVFYKKANVLEAMPVSEEYPAFIEGAALTHNADGSWSIKTDWGESSGFPGKAYWIRYGTKEDGTPDANILTKTEKSYRDYVVCDENGVGIGLLCELDA